MYTLAQVMTKRPVSVTLGESVPAICTALLEHEVRHLPMVTDSGLVRGMVLAHAVHARGTFAGTPPILWMYFDADDEELTARDVCVHWDVVLRQDEPVSRALYDMGGAREDAAVVTDGDGHLTGIFTEHDAAALGARALPWELPALAYSSTPVVCVGPNTSASQAMTEMQRHGLRHLPVIDDGALVGIISDRDVRASAWARGGDVDVERLMGAGPIARAAPNTTLREVAAAMADLRVGCIPLSDKHGLPLRMVTRSDVARALWERLDGREVTHRAA